MTCYGVVLDKVIFIRSLHLYTHRNKRRGVKLAWMLPVSKLPKLPHALLVLEVDPRETSGEKDEGSDALETTKDCPPGVCTAI